jgi:hypothetical protein
LLKKRRYHPTGYLHPARGYALTAQIDRSDGLATSNSPIN